MMNIIQEALSNIYKHAQATEARLTLDFTDQGARLLVEDDGEGFAPQERAAPAIERGHGLPNIEERLKELGASLRIESAPGRGTRLEAVFPFGR